MRMRIRGHSLRWLHKKKYSPGTAGAVWSLAANEKPYSAKSWSKKRMITSFLWVLFHSFCCGCRIHWFRRNCSQSALNSNTVLRLKYRKALWYLYITEECWLFTDAYILSSFKQLCGTGPIKGHILTVKSKSCKLIKKQKSNADTILSC